MSTAEELYVLVGELRFQQPDPTTLTILKDKLNKILYGMNKFSISVEPDHEVISIRKSNETIFTSHESLHDPYLFFDMNSNNELIGIRITAANEITYDFWLHHPDRRFIPFDMLKELDEIIQTQILLT